MDLELSPQDEATADWFLRDAFPQEPYRQPHRHIGPGVVTKAGFWMVTDATTGKPFYGHA